MANGNYTLLFSEVLDKVHKAKTKAEKVAILIINDNSSLRMVLKASFDPKIEWVIPEGVVPYTKNDAPMGTEHTMLQSEARKLWHFIKDADKDTQQAQKEKHWAQFVFNENELRIGILGTGHLGMDAANKLNELGFSVFGYSNSRKETLFPSFSEGELDIFLGQINVLICTVPYTPNTHGLLNYELFQKLKYPTYLINVSRGAVQIEKDILEALDKGFLSGAFLDVFEQEPLVKESPLWDHPKIKITPHIASLTYPEEGIHQVLESFERVEKGLPLKHQIDRKKMY